MSVKNYKVISKKRLIELILILKINMEKEFFFIVRKELKEMEYALEQNSVLKNDIEPKSSLLLLYKIYEIEKRLKIIEAQTKTHWVE